MTVWYVLLLSTITAVCTGLGALPFMFVSKVGPRFVGGGNALAAGLMLGASIGLVWEAVPLSGARTLLGLLLGALLIVAVGFLIPDHEHEEQLAGLDKAGLRKILMVMAIMTAHSFAEGIGVGVSFGGREGLGELISAAIAVHNIPEGIAIALVMVPRGVSAIKAALWSIFSSLPQPLMAVPAFLFVQVFEPTLPVGLGLAAGAMFYMVFFELLPESGEQIGRVNATVIAFVAALAMMGFQLLL